jgi:hypothetical protein
LYFKDSDRYNKLYRFLNKEDGLAGPGAFQAIAARRPSLEQAVLSACALGLLVLAAYNGSCVAGTPIEACFAVGLYTVSLVLAAYRDSCAVGTYIEASCADGARSI